MVGGSNNEFRVAVTSSDDDTGDGGERDGTSRTASTGMQQTKTWSVTVENVGCTGCCWSKAVGSVDSTGMRLNLTTATATATATATSSGGCVRNVVGVLLAQVQFPNVVGGADRRSGTEAGGGNGLEISWTCTKGDGTSCTWKPWYQAQP